MKTKDSMFLSVPRSEWAPDAPGPAPSSPSKRDNQPVKSRSILIVEDDFLIAMQIETALRDAGLALAGTARSAEEALDLAASQKPVLAIMDIRLTGMRDGVDAALDLFREHGIRCVFATAHRDLEVNRRAQPALPLAWLQKPYTIKSLVETVRNALRELDQAGSAG